MNTSALKTFAPAVRRQLMEAVTRKLDYVLSAQTPDYLTTFAPQVAALRRLAQTDRAGLIERVAYIWFNRLAALRFMDARGWHPFRARVLTPASAAETQPELLKLVRGGAIPEELKSSTDPTRLNDLLDGRIPSPDAQGEVYRHLVLAACRFYHTLLPNLFEKLDDETELLLPDDLLTEHSVVHGFRTEISDDDCGDEQRANVEILGWLYQFYISEKKDAVMARKSAVPTEDIPAVTQLFTPHWIVRYLVENSLGRLWMQNRPNSKLRDHMPYYIEEVASGQGSGVSGQKIASPLATGHSSLTTDPYAYQDLQRLDRVAESHGPCGTNVSPHAELPEGGTLRLDQPTEAGGGLRAVKHRRGAGTPVHGGIQELPFDSPGLFGGSGNADPSGHPIPVSDAPAVSQSSQPAGGSFQNALKPAFKTELVVRGSVASDQWPVISKSAAGTATPSGHWPLTTDHSTAGENAPNPFLKIERPEDIRLLDPAVGSGHMLTYAFDLLVLIYEEEGYAPTEIPALILRHNLHGLEICPRAAQLAELALVFKAREKDRRFFQPEHLVRPHIIELRDVRFAESELADYIHALGLGDLFNQPILRLLHQFEEAKNFGSLIQPCLDERAIANARRTLTDHWSLATDHSSGQLFLRETHLKVLRVLDQAEALTQRYHVVVANPPYLGSNKANASLKAFLSDNYSVYKEDVFACFVVRAHELSLTNGCVAMVTMHSWMFLNSFEALRTLVLDKAHVNSLLHLGPRAFDSIGGEIVQTVAFSMSKHSRNGSSQFVRLVEGSSEAEKVAVLLDPVALAKITFSRSTASFRGFPSRIFAYWLPPTAQRVLSESPAVSSITRPRQGMATMDNTRFLRFWHEVALANIGFGCESEDQSVATARTWFPYNKGGSTRRWYGNQEYIVKWAKGGEELCNLVRERYGSVSKRIVNREFFFKPAVTWSKIGTGSITFRHQPSGSLFDVAGTSLFPADSSVAANLLGQLNSNVATYFLQAISPTVNFEVSHIGAIPLPPSQVSVETGTCEAVAIARADWDNFETSWDFRGQPLLRPGLKGATLEASWRNWETQSTAAIRQMQELETENNRLFIAAYGLEGELQPEVPQEQITLARADARKDMAAFLSYAVGCMFGRYSLSAPGLILANAGDTLEDFWKKVASDQWPVAREKASSDAASQRTTGHWPLTPEFHPDPDGILPVLDGEWFEDDIVARTRDFLRVTFGEATLRENLRFIEDALGKDLRKYFLTDFYKDHLQTYKKRPIYWMVQSPKKGFSVLLYLHRYTRDTMNLVLNRYLRDYEVKLRNRLTHLAEQEATAPSAKAKTEARKEGDKLKKILHECEEWERQTPMALV